MSKRELIDEIRQLNGTAPARFLAQFDEAALQQYLVHLKEARAKCTRRLAAATQPMRRQAV